MSIVGQELRFEQVIVPNLDAAFNLARWMTRNDQDAEDVVQEACLRAIRYAEGFQGGDSRAWLLTIVRNTYLTWRSKNRKPGAHASFDEELHSPETVSEPAALPVNLDPTVLNRAIDELPDEFKEAFVLRELEGMSYSQIATLAGVPIGTVMSRISRARKRLQVLLAPVTNEKESPREV